MKSNQIVPYKHPASSFVYNVPQPKENQYKNTITAIKNAWNNSTSLDDLGQVWVETKKLHSILRTSKGNAKYIVASISDDNKLIIDKKTYIRGYELMKLIDKMIQECGLGTKGEYLRYSEKHYIAIRDCDKANNLRAEAEKLLLKVRKTLKKKRRSLYKISIDELTGEVLDVKNSDFSHIRSCSLYPSLADNINNGLVVNKSTHNIITEKNINDEEELYDICKSMGWQTDWYDKYKKDF